MSRKNKSTSFNLNDAYELELLKHAEQQENGNFSRYVKRLIVKDRDGSLSAINQINVAPTKKEAVKLDASKEDIDAMSDFL